MSAHAHVIPQQKAKRDNSNRREYWALAFQVPEWKRNQMEREMLVQGSQEPATWEHSHPPTPITASQAQAMMTIIILVPKLLTLLPRHCTHGMALSALLVQGGSEGLNGSHITTCLADRYLKQILCRSLLLTSAPTNCSPSFPAPRFPY